MIESPDDWAIFTNPNDFGEAVTYTRQGQAPVSVNGIFTAAYALIAQGVASTSPVLAIGEAALPFTPEDGDLVTLTRNHADYPAGTILRVADPQPDGSGLIRLILERN